MGAARSLREGWRRASWWYRAYLALQVLSVAAWSLRLGAFGGRDAAGLTVIASALAFQLSALVVLMVGLSRGQVPYRRDAR